MNIATKVWVFCLLLAILFWEMKIPGIALIVIAIFYFILDIFTSNKK